MSTYTSNYGWTKPEGSDPVDIGVLNGNLDSQDNIVHNAYMQLAPVFSTASTYAVDDVVLYSNNLYKCHTAVTVAGDWDASKWTQVKVSDIAGGGGGGGTSDYTDLTNKPQINGVTLTGNKSTSDLGINATAVGLGNVPNVATDDQTPTFTTAQSRNNLVSGEKISVMLGKISKFFNDLKTVAFTGSYDDLTNKPATTVIDWADWILLTPQEQESGDYTVIGCPWADGDVSVDLMKKLWENPNPTADFASQSVELSDSGYDFLLIMFKNVKSVSTTLSCVYQMGKPSDLIYPQWAGGTAGNYNTMVSLRGIGYTDSTHISIGDATTNGTTNNAMIIPTAIYGIKTTASVKINAVAMDVSTSADKCMLSDGVTSVEDNCAQRTKTGTTLSTLLSAIAAINTVDVSKIDKIIINNVYIVIPQQTAVFDSLSVGTNSMDVFQLSINSGTFKRYEYRWNGTSATATDVSVTSWTIYYHGAEVS